MSERSGDPGSAVGKPLAADGLPGLKGGEVKKSKVERVERVEESEKLKM